MSRPNPRQNEASESAGSTEEVLANLIDKKSGRRGLRETSDPTIRAMLENAAGELDGRLNRALELADETIYRTLKTYVEDLPELAADLADNPDFHAQNQLLTEHYYWHDVMSDIEYLEILYRQGRFTAETAGNYERLKKAIADQRPLIKRLEFYVPEIPLEH